MLVRPVRWLLTRKESLMVGSVRWIVYLRTGVVLALLMAAAVLLVSLAPLTTASAVGPVTTVPGDTTDPSSTTTDTTDPSSTTTTGSTGTTDTTATTSTTLSTTTTTAPGRVDTYFTGADRYATSILVSEKAYPSGAPAVILVKGTDFPDALAAAPLAVAYGGPVILVPATGLTQPVKDELRRLKPDTVFYIGLPISQRDVVSRVLPAADVRSIIGRDRYETATLIADELKKKVGSISKIVLVPGDRFPDALAVAPLAAQKGWPILLTPAAGPLPAVTSAKIQKLGATSALVVGTYVKPPLPIPAANVVAKVGRDRYYTGAMVAEYAQSMGSTFVHIALATGENYPDALVIGPYLALDSGILLLTLPTSFSPPVNNLLAKYQDGLKMVDFVGMAKSSLLSKRLVTVPIPPPPPVYPELRWGSTGTAVSTLEAKLSALRYDIGRADGVYDEALRDAVMAFQKTEWLTRDGVARLAVWKRLETARVPTARYYTSYSHIEIDLSRQVLFLVSGGTVVKILPVSTGTSATRTPAGSFHITRKLDYWRRSSLGLLYMPSYFYGGIAIHGSYSVPNYPASHGCVRIPVWATVGIYYQMPVGMSVRVYY